MASKYLVISNGGCDCYSLDRVPNCIEAGEKLIKAMDEISQWGWNRDEDFEHALEMMSDLGWKLISVVSNKYTTCVFKRS